MLSDFKNKLSYVIKAIIWLIALIADAYTLGVLAVGAFDGSFNELVPQLAFIIIVLVLALIYFFMKISSYVNQLDLLCELSKRGHFHTMRMVLLVDKERKAEHLPLNPNRAEFTFEIGPCVNDRSSVSYRHRFSVRKVKEGPLSPKAWIFGDLNIKPEQLEYIIRGTKQKKVTPEIEGIEENEASFNNGIYNFKWKFDSEIQKNDTEVDLQYVRNGAFPWNRNHKLIIYPDCFFKDIKEVSFSVKVGRAESARIDSVEFLEINGAKISTYDKSNQSPVEEDGNIVYKTGEYIKVHKGSVYIITVNVIH